MVSLNRVKVKNFKSIGGRWIEFNLNKLNGLTLIQGRNGAGKTTIISVIVFGLYGKNSDLKGNSKSSLPVSELINDITCKDLMVIIELESNGHQYRIERGLKPKVLDIWKDDEKLNQQASIVYDQEWIEMNILNGIDFDMFSKIVYLSSKATSTPWLYQTPLQRKEFIEELLNIRILFDIGELAKKKRNRTNIDIKQLQAQLELKKESIIELAGVLKKQKQEQEQWEERQKEKIKEEEEFLTKVENSIKETKEELKEVEEKLKLNEERKQKLVDWLDKHSEYNDKLDQVLADISSIESSISNITMDIKLQSGKIENEKNSREKYSVCGDCPTVEKLAGSFDFNKEEKHLIDLQNTLKNQRTELEVYQSKRTELEPVIESIGKVEKKLYDINRSITQQEEQIKNLNWKIYSWGEQTQKTKKAIENLKQESIEKKEIDLSKLIQWKDEYKEMQSDHDSLEERRTLYEHIYKVATSDEIKKSMYDIYIPLLRGYIKEFVEQFTQHDFASFRLEVDDSFNIGLYKNGREFNVFSLSEGQKGSINLSLTFAFQKLIEFKNQINLLMIDEILDMSFDEDRLESIIIELKKMSINKQIFIISHNKDIQESLFDNVIEVKMVDGFSDYQFS